MYVSLKRQYFFSEVPFESQEESNFLSRNFLLFFSKNPLSVISQHEFLSRVALRSGSL